MDENFTASFLGTNLREMSLRIRYKIIMPRLDKLGIVSTCRERQ